jgi:ABC-type histidine transport system ATPase subunit
MPVVMHEMAFTREVSNKVVFLHKGKSKKKASPGRCLHLRNPCDSISF